MKSLLIADLLIIIAFFSLSKPTSKLTSTLTVEEYKQLTQNGHAYNSIPLPLFGEYRYLSEEDSLEIALQFFALCLGKEKQCDVELSLVDGELEIVGLD